MADPKKAPEALPSLNAADSNTETAKKPKAKARLKDLPDESIHALAAGLRFMQVFDTDEQKAKRKPKPKPKPITETEKRARKTTKQLQDIPSFGGMAERRAMRMAKQGAVAGGIRLADRAGGIAEGAVQAFKPGAFGRLPRIATIGEEFQKETRTRAEEEPFIKNALVDTAEVIGGIPMLMATFLGPAPPGMTEREFGRQAGKEATAGIVGGIPAQISQVISEPITSFEGRPLSTALAAADIGRIAAGGVRVAAPRASRAARATAETVGPAVTKAASEVSEAAAGAVHKGAQATEALSGKPVLEAIPQVANVIDRGLSSVLTKEGRANIAAHIADGAKQLDPRATAIAHAIMASPERAVQELRAFGYRLAKQAAKRPPAHIDDVLTQPGTREHLVSSGGLGSDDMARRRIIDIDVDTETVGSRSSAAENLAKAERQFAHATEAQRLAAEDVRQGRPGAQAILDEANADVAFVTERRETARAESARARDPLSEQPTRIAGEHVIDQLMEDSGIGTALSDMAEWGQRHGLDSGEVNSLLTRFSNAVGDAYMRDAARLASLPGVSKKVAQEVAKRLGKPGNRKLIDDIAKSLRESAGEMVDIRGKDGISLPIEDIVADVIGKKPRADLVDGAVASAQQRLSSALEDRLRLRGLADESTRVPMTETTHGPENVPVRYPDAEPVARGEVLPIVLPDDVDTAAAAAAYRTRAATATPQEAARLNAAASHLEKYRDVTVDGARFKAAPLFAGALEWQARAKEAFASGDWLTGLVNLQKRGLVPRSIKSIINNFGSNVALQALIRADPFVVPRALRLSDLYLRKFRAGEAVPPDLQRAFKALDRTGLVNSNRLAKDIGQSKFDPLRIIQQPLEALFGFGDNLFKIEDFVANFQEVGKYLDDLEPGRTMSLEGDRGPVLFHRNNQGQMSAKRGHTGKAMNVENALGEVSAVPGRRKFIDYGDQTRLGAKLRGSSFRGIGTGFYTWMAGVTDIPFVKKGLGYRLLAGPISVITDSPKVNKALLMRDVGFGMRRAMVTAGTKSSFLSREAQEEADLSKFHPGEGGIRPTFVGKDENHYMRFDSWNFLQPSMAIARIAAGMYATATGAEKKALEEMARITTPPKAILEKPEKMAQWWVAQRLSKFGKLGAMSATGQLAPMSAVLDLVGLSGSPILSIWEKIKDTEEAGKVMTVKDMYKVLGPAMFGSTYSNLFSSTVEAVSGNAPVTGDQLVEWAILTNLGLGWRNVDVGKQLGKKGFSWSKKLGDEWKASLGLPEKRKELRTTMKVWDKLPPELQLGVVQHITNKTEPGPDNPQMVEAYGLFQRAKRLEADIGEIKSAVDTAVGKLLEQHEVRRMPAKVKQDLGIK